MRILSVLTYYRPHISGLTIYAERLAKAWARRGHQVTILTSHYQKDLPYDEIVDGVRIVRAPVAFRISKGVIMPTIGLMANRLVADNDVVTLHLPQFDAAGIALRGKVLRKPTVITYHCDLLMPPGLMSQAANQAVLMMNHLAARSAHRIVTYTQDYADHSKYLTQYKDKLRIIPPPVELPNVTLEEVKAFADTHNPQGQKPVIGMMARFATEKGVEVLLKAMPAILEKYPQAVVWFAGPYQKIIGEEAYFERLAPEIQRLERAGHWKFMGSLNPAQAAAYFPNLDVHVLPSLNSTEAFGLVQIEGMINGVPSVASNLPGVRQPVTVHGMGKIFEIGDADGLARSVLEILDQPLRYRKDPEPIRNRYLPDTIAMEYEILFSELQREIANGR